KSHAGGVRKGVGHAPRSRLAGRCAIMDETIRSAAGQRFTMPRYIEFEAAAPTVWGRSPSLGLADRKSAATPRTVKRTFHRCRSGKACDDEGVASRDGALEFAGYRARGGRL